MNELFKSTKKLSENQYYATRHLIKYLLLLLLFVFIACEKNKPGKEDEIYYIFIKDTYPIQAQATDTVLLYMDWMNSESTADVTVTVDNIDVLVLGLVNDTTIQIVLPIGISNGFIRVTHNNGAVAERGIDIPKEAVIKKIDKLSGKPGDLVTITGLEFKLSDSIGVIINTMPCDIVELEDTKLVFRIPEGSGNGIISVAYWNENYGCKPTITRDMGMFSLEYEQPATTRRIKNYSDGNNTFILERDSEGRVYKKIYESNTNFFDLISYGSDGLVDTIKYMNQSKMVKYMVYARNHDNSQLEISHYDKEGKFTDKEESFWQDGKVIQLNWYKSYEGEVWQTFHNQYTYGDSTGTLVRTFYTGEGEVDWVWEFDIEFDMHNGKYPDIGIPGYENEYKYYPYKKFGVYNSKLVYNNYGELISWKSYNNCEYQYTSGTFSYE